jgi:hypothetical protein
LILAASGCGGGMDGECEAKGQKETPERVRGGESFCGVIYKSRGSEAGSLESFDGFFSLTLGGGGTGYESREELYGAYNVAVRAVAPM